VAQVEPAMCSNWPHSRTREAWCGSGPCREDDECGVWCVHTVGALAMAPWIWSLLVQRVQRVARVRHGCEVESKSEDAMRALCCVRAAGDERARAESKKALILYIPAAY
jgi:hypothetical protein